MINLAGAADRSIPPTVDKKMFALTVLIVGASNAGRLGEALKSLVAKVDQTIISNWRPTKESLELLAGSVARGVELVKPDMVVF